MKAILEIPEARRRVKRWTVKTYEHFTELGAFEKSVELIRGIIVEKTSKSPLHRHTALALYDLLSKTAPAGLFVLHESPLKFGDSEPEPDVSVVRGDRRDYRTVHPTTAALVIEVAVSSAALDRENAGLYAEAGVEEYWIVLPKLKRVEVYRQPQSGRYTVTSSADSTTKLRSASVPEIAVNLPDLFSEL